MVQDLDFAVRAAEARMLEVVLYARVRPGFLRVGRRFASASFFGNFRSVDRFRGPGGSWSVAALRRDGAHSSCPLCVRV